jgi:hypothetical protein
MAASKHRKPRFPARQARTSPTDSPELQKAFNAFPEGDRLSDSENRYLLNQEILFLLASLGDGPRLRSALTAARETMPVELIN